MKKIRCVTLWLPCLLLFYHTVADAQVSGSVIDENNTPVVYGTVMLLSSEDSTLVKGNITDEAGAFSFEDISTGHYLVRVSYVGYETTHSPTFSISPEQSTLQLQPIRLVGLSQSLEEITITAQRPLIEKQPDRLIMNLENSLLTKGSTVDQLLKMAPLVSSDMNGNLSLRGKKNVMVLVDGRNIPDATLSSILQNTPADQIDKIEIITNPSAKYDASASGGVINIITKRKLEAGFNGSFRTSYSQGQRGRFSAGTSLNYRTNRLNVYSDINFYKGNSYNVDNLFRQFPKESYNMNNRTTYNSAYESFAGKIGLDYMPSEDHTIGIMLDSYVSGTDILLSTRSDFMSQRSVPDSSIISQGDWVTDYDIHNINLNYQGELKSSGGDISLNATQTFYRQGSSQSLTYQPVFSEQTQPIRKQTIQTSVPSDINITIAQADLTQPLWGKYKLEAGAKYTHIDTKNNFTQKLLNHATQQTNVTDSSQLNYSEDVTAGYVSLNTIFGKYSVQAGLRIEQTNTNVQNTIERSFFDLFPNFSLSRNVNDDYALSLTYSRKIDRPIYDNLLPFRVFVDPYTVRQGNPLLQPQYSHVIELANTFKSVTFLLGYTNIKDAMLDIPYQDEEVTIFSWRNFSLVETYNLSVVLPLQITPWWQSNSTVSGLFNRVKTSDNNIPNFEKDMFSFTLNSTNTFSLGNSINATLTGYYNSASQYGISEMLPVYSISMGIGKDIFNDLGTIRLNIDDILWSERYRFDIRTESVIQTGNNYYDTRRVQLSFTYKFGKQTVKKSRDRRLGNEDESNRLTY